MSSANAPERKKQLRKSGKPLVPSPASESEPPVLAAVAAPPGAETHVPGEYGPPPTLGVMLQALRRRWLLAFGLALPGGLLAAFAAWFLFPPKFTAHVLLHLASKPPDNAFVTPENRGELAVFQKNVLAMLKTRSVLEGALEVLDGQEVPTLAQEDKPVVWLDRNLQGDFLLGHEILRLTLKGDRPDDLAVILNAVTQSYFSQASRLDREKRAEHLRELLASQDAQGALLLPKQERLKALEKESAVNDPATAAANYATAYNVLHLAEDKLQKATFERKRLELEMVALTAQDRVEPAVLVPEAMIDDAMSHDLAAQKQREKLATVQQEIDETLRVAAKKEKEPTLQPLLRERTALREALDAYREEHRLRLAEDLATKARMERAAQIAKLEADLQIAQEQCEALAEEVARRRAEVERFNTRSTVELDALRNDVMQSEAELKKLGARIEAVRSEPVGAARVTLIESAVPPQLSNRDRQLRLVAAAGLGAFGLILGAVTLVELRARKITSVDEVVHGVGLNVVGALPVVPERMQRVLPSAVPADDRAAAWPSLLTESVDAMRTLLLHAARVEPLRVVMITSAMSGEGKTSLACHLASSLARAGQKTLLVDGDLRLPTVHRMLGLPACPGLNEILRDEANPEEVLQETSVANLWVMTAGKSDPRSLQGLSSPMVRTLFLDLREQFDFVIVDSSPVLPVADALLIGQHVDAVLFSILGAVSRLPTVHAAHQRLSVLGIRLLGAVVIGANEEVYRTGYPYAIRG